MLMNKPKRPNGPDAGRIGVSDPPDRSNYLDFAFTPVTARTMIHMIAQLPHIWKFTRISLSYIRWTRPQGLAECESEVVKGFGHG
jgi:hypothetical protein